MVLLLLEPKLVLCSHEVHVDRQQTAPGLVIWSEGDLGQSYMYRS